MFCQIAQFGLVELMAEVLTKIVYGRRTGKDQLAVAAVGAGVVACQRLADKRIATAQLRRVVVTVASNIAPGQYALFRPRRADAAVVRCQLLQRVFGQLAVGRQLAAKDGEQGRFALVITNIESIVAGNRLR